MKMLLLSDELIACRVVGIAHGGKCLAQGVPVGVHVVAEGVEAGVKIAQFRLTTLKSMIGSLGRAIVCFLPCSEIK